MQTIQSSYFDLRLFLIHCKWTKSAKFKNMSESCLYVFVKQNCLEMPMYLLAKIYFIPFVHWHAHKPVKRNLDSSVDATIFKIGHLSRCHDRPSRRQIHNSFLVLQGRDLCQHYKTTQGIIFPFSSP